MSLIQENQCVRCGVKFDTFVPRQICDSCWTAADTLDLLRLQRQRAKADARLVAKHQEAASSNKLNAVLVAITIGCVVVTLAIVVWLVLHGCN